MSANEGTGLGIGRVQETTIDKFPSEIWSDLTWLLDPQWVYNLFMTGSGRIRQMLETQQVILSAYIKAKHLSIFKRFRFLTSCRIKYGDISEMNLDHLPSALQELVVEPGPKINAFPARFLYTPDPLHYLIGFVNRALGRSVPE